MIELMINKAEEFDADVTYSGYDYVTENGIHYKRYDDNFRYIDDYIDGITALEKIINNKIHIWTGSVIYNKSFLDKHGLKYYEGCNYGEDFEFICKALCKSKRVTCVKGILAHYLQRSSSLVHNFNISNFKSLGAMNRLKWYVSKNCSDDEIIKAFNDNFNREALVIYNRYITNAKPSEKMDNIFKIMNSKYRKRLKAYKLKNLSKERVKRYILVNLYVFNLKIYTSFMKKKHHI